MRDLPLTVRAKNRTECEVLSPATCVIWSTFYVTWAVNQSWELHVTLMDDSSLAYELADIEGSVFFDNQEYIIKQCKPDYNLGANTKELTCTHVYNQLSQIRKTESNEDEKTYSLEDVLNFFLDGNKLGFSYEIHGAFENQRIQGLGNGSGMDMLSQITSTWPKSVIFPRNRVIRIYDEDSFYHDYGNRIDYLHDTKEVKLTIDSTSLTNIVYCAGGTHTVEHSETEEKEVNYFEPFTYRDEESIAEWGEYPAEPIEDERFHDENAMREYAKSRLQTNPNMAVEVTMDTNSKPEAGETRLLKVQNALMTRVKVVGYTWYPYDVNTATTLNLDDIPLTVLNQNGKIDALAKELQERAKRTADELRARILNQRRELSRLNSLPKVYYSGEDPSNTESVKAGDLWFEY